MLSTKREVQLKNANETQGLSDVSAISGKCAVAKVPSDHPTKRQFSCSFFNVILDEMRQFLH